MGNDNNVCRIAMMYCAFRRTYAVYRAEKFVFFKFFFIFDSPLDKFRFHSYNMKAVCNSGRNMGV